MKGLLQILGASVMVAGVLGSTQALAQPVGLWNTEDNQGQVQVSPCGDKLCGELVWLAEPMDSSGQPKLDQHNPDETLRDRPVQGLRILWDMEPTGDGKTWDNGKVYDPESGKTYQGKITLDGVDVLKLRGFVGAPIFGRTSTWTRAETPGAAD
ncbi:DUF2147 domain-containing protein [Pseudomonas sp. FME51]|uniref:DUF2147 domain-containing protein n=1 Tax=Pseudomonas sp. FME51 TaxID=2742609 RepID=UPI00186968FA|nr:DUF2147 domain-containing protein [Pseudomonas sp. FME51]